MKNASVLLMTLVVLTASVWLTITSLRPAKHRTVSPIAATATPHGLEVASQQSPRPGAPTPSPALSPIPAVKEGAPTFNPPQGTPSSSPWPAATVQPSRTPEKKALASSLLPKESSPPLLATALPPADPGSNVAPAKQQAAEETNVQTYNNGETFNFEPTTLTVVRTFVLSLPDGSQVEQSISIPVLYRKGSIALNSDQLAQLGVTQSQIQRILDANEELRVAADLLITRQRKSLSGSVPAEVLSARSSSVLPGGPTSPGTNYVNVPQGSVEIAPTTKEP